LKTGDIVNINTFKNRYSAVKHWIDYIHTPSAHGQLVKYIRMQEREARLDEAIEGLNKYLKTLGLPQFRSDKDQIQKLAEPLEVERRILLVLDRQETYGNIVRAAYPDLMKTLHEKTVLTDTTSQQQELKQTIQTPPADVSREVIVDNDKSLHCIFCPECDPHPGDKIIAKSGKEGIKIHTMQCKALKTLSYASLLEAHRKADVLSTTYTIHTQLKFSQNKMTIVDIIALFSAFSIPIFKFELEKAEDNRMVVKIAGEVSNPAKL
jgi:(p)ppGpp synthase/HD superfamily hydrolase